MFCSGHHKALISIESSGTEVGACVCVCMCVFKVTNKPNSVAPVLSGGMVVLHFRKTTVSNLCRRILKLFEVHFQKAILPSAKEI